MNVAPIRRRMKNVVRNYSEAQRKVREATSNDPWGPSSSLMSEIADLTYNVVAFSEIMQMIWKRLNDHGKNWRHVYKALVLLEYIIKTGTEKVAQQCKENIFAIQTLKDFQYIEENKDQGMNVREKAKQLVALLKDDERLKNERARALKAKERFAQTATGIGSNSSQYGRAAGGSPQPDYQSGYSESHVKEDQEGAVEPELECARPQTAGEEELQLQLALAMSKEEAEQEERIRRGDDVRLQLALTESQEDFRKQQEQLQHTGGAALLDILDTSSSVAPLTDPWGVPLTSSHPTGQTDNWGSPSTARSTPALATDPWGTQVSRSTTPSSSGTTPTRAVTAPSRPSTQPVNQTDPWSSQSNKSVVPAVLDPWGAPLTNNSPPNIQQTTGGFDAFSTQSNGDLDDFELISSRNTASLTNNGFDVLGGSSSSQSPFDFASMKQTLSNSQQQQTAKRKTPESFLGENSSLVNLDALVTKSTSQVSSGSTNPFATGGANNPFQAGRQSVPMNQMRSPTMNYQASSDTALPTPMLPNASTMRSQTPSSNPFL